MVTKDEEKAEVLNVLFASAFNDQTSSNLDTQPPELTEGGSDQNEAPIFPRKNG